MYTNSAYIGEMHEDIVDTSKPILVTAAGYFRLEKTPVFETVRPEPRGDYQLLSILFVQMQLSRADIEKLVVATRFGANRFKNRCLFKTEISCSGN